jgi:hypothetical protein
LEQRERANTKQYRQRDNGCGLEIGDRAEWVLRDRLTGEVLRRRETVSQVDLWSHLPGLLDANANPC